MRLIDIDVVIKNALTDTEGEYLKSIARHAPTIDAVPQWIPCDERLPKCNETIIFTEVCRTDARKPYVGIGVYYGIDEWNYFKSESEKKKLDELGYMSDRIRIGGRKWHVEDSNVVAWMPLPKPYEGERSE